MPRKLAVSPEESISAIKKFMQYFAADPLPPWSSKVWKELSVALDGKWNIGTCYINVYHDRHFILSRARQEMGIIVPNVEHNKSDLVDSTIISEMNSDESHSVLNYSETELDTFDLILTEQQWNEIKPDVNQNENKRGSSKLKPGVWTNEIAFLFFQQYRFPCAYIFKRADVSFSQNDTMYIIKITGSCKSKKCGNIFRGYAEKHIGVDGLTMYITTRDSL